MKTKVLILFLIILLSSCRNNAQPSTIYEPDKMMNQYLFGPFSMNVINSEITIPVFHSI